MDKKLIYFLLAFSLFYFIYYRFVLSPMEEKSATARRPAPAARLNTAPPPSPQTQTFTSPAATQTVPAKTPSQPASLIIMETPLYRAEISNKGAILKSFRLKRYKDDYNQPLEMIPQVPAQELPLSLDFDDKALSKTANETIYTIAVSQVVQKKATAPELEMMPTSGTLTALNTNEAQTVQLLYSDGTHSFSKRLTFHGDSYLIDGVIEASKADGGVLPVRINWAPGLESLKSYKQESGLKPSRALVNSGEKVEHLDAKDAKEYKKIGSTVRWAGVENNYFLAVFIPPPNLAADAYMHQVNSGEHKEAHQVNLALTASRGEPLRFTLFVGPKDYLLLKEMGMDLENAVDFGFFGPVAKGMFFVLRYFYNFTGNYGWAIILVTILIKIIFTPFTQMSFASMKKMQQMQPELKKVQEKYAKMKNDDPRKQNMNVEIMQLHKRYGVNPLGGCLPMLLQMPVLIAFYQLLSNAIELRGAPFGLWLQDLSQPDPWKVTPILMGATMLLQQKMTPASDPMQQKMMYIMPIMFTFMSLNFPSGLVVYWFFSNILAIAHQFYFQRQQKATVAVATTK